MKRLTIDHRTAYIYRRPVRFGEHQLMFRPRDSHDLRLVETGLKIQPVAEIRWIHDVFSNSIAIATFSDEATELRFENRIVVEHYPSHALDFTLAHYAETFPFSYPSDVVPDLARCHERHYLDPDDRLSEWVKKFLNANGATETTTLLERINGAIRNEFGYENRTEPGTRTPAEMFRAGTGTCRDYALFMMEAARSLGLAARFVTGYLYDPAIDDSGAAQMTGAGATHAWVQVFLPGAGWIEYDPTNGIVGGSNLIRVAVTRDPAQAIPLQGSYIGAAEDFERMEIDVSVTATVGGG